MVAFTTALRLGLPTIGGDYNEWGGYLNETISLLEQAITGVAVIDLTGLTTYTLSTNDNEADEARNATLRFIGTPAATVAVRIPSSAKQYYVRNDTSKTVTFATLGNAAVSVDAGFAAIITTDGTTCYVSLLPTENWLYENFIRADGSSQALILTRHDTTGNATKDQVGISCGRDNNASTGALYLKLAVTDGTTVTSTKLYQNGTLVFPDGSVAMTIDPSTSIMKQAAITATVTDFTKNYLLGANQADRRYIRSPANPNTDARILTISRNKTSGGIFVTADDGSNTQIQPAGDYATNSALNTALNTETTNRTRADTNLQNQINNRVIKTGDTMSGPLLVSQQSVSSPVHYSASLGTRIDGYYINNYGVPSTSGVQYEFDMWMEVNPGVSTYGVLRAWTWKGERRWLFNEDGNIVSGINGNVAWQSQLPTAGTITNGTYTKVPLNDGSGRSVLRQSFVLQVNDYATVNFPITYPNPPVLNVYSSDESQGKSIISNYRWNTLTGSSFVIHNSWASGGTNGNQDGMYIHVVAEGIV